MASAKLKAAVKRIKGTLDRNYETSVATPTAGPVGSGKLFIGGQVFDGDITGVTQVVNVGRPAAAQYAAKYGGGGGTTVVPGGSSSSSSSGSTADLTTLYNASYITAEEEAPFPNSRQISSTNAITITDNGPSGFLIIGMATPPTLSVSSINDATNGSHAILSNSNPGAAASLLASDATGKLTLPLLAASTSVTTPSILSTGNLSIAPTGGNTTVTGTGTVTSTFTVGANTVNATAVAEMRSNADYGSTLKVYRNNSNRWNVDFSSADLLSFVDATTSTSRFAMTLAGNAMIGTTTDNGYKLDVAGTMRATTSLTTPLLTTATNVDLIINPAGTGAVQFPNDQTLRTSDFDSSFPIEGWQINEVVGVSGYSALTIGKIQADELAVRVFVADEVRVDRGDEFWTKSYGIVAESFTTPGSVGGTVSVMFEDSPALAGAIFTNNDWVLIRKLDIDTGITLSNVWGQVATYVNNSDGTQNWTFTLRSGPTSESITKGSLAIDFGASGAALIHLSVIDSAGAPYIKMRKWAGANPYTPSNFTTYVQLGELGSTGNAYVTPAGYGLYVRSTGDDSRFLLADDNGLQIRGASFKMYDGAAQTVDISSTDGSMKLGTDVSSSATTAFDFDAATGDLSITGDLYTSDVYLTEDDGILINVGSTESIAARKAITWYPDITSISGDDPILSIYAASYVGGDVFSVMRGESTTDISTLRVESQGYDSRKSYIELVSRPSDESVVTISADTIALLGWTDPITMSDISVGGDIAVSGTVDGVDIAAFKTAYDSHTHSGYLATTGGTLTGTLITDIMRPATNNTKTVGTASYYYNAGYFDSLYVNTIVGPPSYSHTHSASDITSGTLDFARMATTWTGALTMDADAAGGNSNYIRWLTQTSTIKAWDLIGRAHDYATTAQQNDLLLTYTDNTTTYIVFQADNATRIIDFLNTPTVGGTAVSLSGHTHDDRYYTETEVNSLLSGYVPTSRTVTAGSGLTGGGALSTNITLNLDTPGSLSVSSSNSASGNHAHAITASSAPGAATSLLKSDTSGNLTLPTFAASTSVTTPLLIATNRLGISTGTSGVTESTAYNGVYVHAAGNAAVQLLTPNTSVGLVTFGDPEDNDIGRILYRHSTDVLDLEAGASLRLRLGGATYAADVTGALRATGAIYADAGMTTSAGNLTLTSTGGTVAVTGALTGSSTGVFTSTLTAASDTDAINAFGRVRLGYAVATDTASFAHFDHNSSTNFALSQSAAGATVLNAASGQAISLGNAGGATATVSASGIDLQSGKHIGSYNYASQSAGWRVDSLGGGDFRYLYADQLHVKAFIADLEQALAGGQIISKSVAVLASDFVAPYAGGTQLLTVEDLPSASNMPVFEANDIVAMRSFSRASGTLSVAYCFGTVTGYTDGTGVQTWTFTRSGTTTYNAITQRGTATSNSTSSGTSTTVTKPTGVISGDVMLAVVTHDGAADTITATGWTIIGTYTSGTDINFAMYYRVAGGAEGSNYSFSTVSSHALAASIVAYYNVATPIFDDYSISTNSASTSMTGATVFGTATANMLVFLGGITNNSSVTPASGMTELIDAGSTGIRVYVAHQTLAASGETGSKVATIAASHASIVGMVALRPTYSAMTAAAGQVVPGTTIEADTLVLDFGIAGNGYYEVTAVDGAYGSSSPYAQVVTYATHPAVDGVARVRMGNLTGVSGASAGEYGLYAGSGTIATTAQYLRVSTAGVQLNNVPIVVSSGGTEALRVTPSEGIRIRAGSSVQNQIDVYSSSDKVYAQWTQLDAVYSNTETQFISYGKTGLGMGTLTLKSQSADGVDSAYIAIGSTYINIVGKPLTVFNGATINSGLALSAGDLDMNGNDIVDIGTIGESWSTLTLNTGGNWANYGGSYFNAAYKKIGDLVFLRGLVKRTSGSNATIATLPSGTRPSSYVLRSSAGDDLFARIIIQSDGVMTLATGTAVSYLSLDGLWFSTA